jgi:hypothetical protein
MEKKNEALGVSFTLPERITVRLQLKYNSEAVFAWGKERFERYWLAAQTIIQDWKCDLIPKPDELNLDEVFDPKIAEIITWTAWEVKMYMDKLDQTPKN